MLTDFLIAALVTLFVTIGPIDNAPIFLGLCRNKTAAERRAIATRASVIAGIVLLAFAMGGDKVLSLLGIGMPAFRIAGGILLLLVAIDLVLVRRLGLSSVTPTEVNEAESPGDHDIAVFPLAIPLVSGPGAMTAVVLLMGEAGDRILYQASVIAAIIAVVGCNTLTFLWADRIIGLMGRTGVNVITRVAGILLAALAVQFALDGLKTAGLG